MLKCLEGLRCDVLSLSLCVRECSGGGLYLGSGAGAGEKPGAPSGLHVGWSSDGGT